MRHITRLFLIAFSLYAINTFSCVYHGPKEKRALDVPKSQEARNQLFLFITNPSLRDSLIQVLKYCQDYYCKDSLYAISLVVNSSSFVTIIASSSFPDIEANYSCVGADVVLDYRIVVYSNDSILVDTSLLNKSKATELIMENEVFLENKDYEAIGYSKSFIHDGNKWRCVYERRVRLNP
jgi:hypothetical protein